MAHLKDRDLTVGKQMEQADSARRYEEEEASGRGGSGTPIRIEDRQSGLKPPDRFPAYPSAKQNLKKGQRFVCFSLLIESI